MNRERITVLSRPLVRVHDLDADAVFRQKQRGDEADWTGADDEDFRIGMTKHEPPQSTLASCARIVSMGAFTHANIGVSRCV